MRSAILVLVLACGGLLAASEHEPPGVTVFAAASAADALAAIGVAFRASTGTPVVVSSASSATLARQIAHGAPAQIFISADERWMDEVERGGLLEPGSRRDLLANRLVLIANRARPVAVTVDAAGDPAAAFHGRFAIADPDSVPAGIYAKQAFTSLGWWSRLAPRLAPAADVRAAVRLVELGECDLGVAYASDVAALAVAAAAAGRPAAVVAVGDIPAATHAPIRYPIALTRTAGPEAAAFAAFLLAPAARTVFATYGFAMADAAAGKP